jgi:alpha-L-fucosidase
MLKRFFRLFFLAGALLALSCGENKTPELPPPPTSGLDGSHKGPAAIFIGDSITWQWTRDGFHPVYFTSHGYVNKGISGNTTVQMLSRFQEDVVSLDPYCVVIEGGTNDIAQRSDEAVLSYLKRMVEQALAAGIPVVLGSVPPSNSFPKLPDFRPEDRIISLNALIKAYAAEKKIPYADYYSVLVDGQKGLKAEYQKDSIHPNAAGYIAMEGVIQPILESILK